MQSESRVTRQNRIRRFIQEACRRVRPILSQPAVDAARWAAPMHLENLEHRQMLTAVITGTALAGQQSGFTPSATDLINGLPAASSTYTQEQAISGPINLLNDGKTSTDPANKNQDSSSTNAVYNPSAQWMVSYNLPVNANGWTITSIDSIAGHNNGAINQLFEISVRTKDGFWATPISPTGQGFAYNPGITNGASKVSITDTRGVLATGVVEIVFQSLGADGITGVTVPGAVFRELDVFGTPTVATTQPKNVKAKPGSNAVRLTWDAVPNAESYDILRSDSLNGWYSAVNFEPVKDVSYLDTSAYNGSTYYYKIRPSNTLGSGPESVAVTATPSASIRPDAPTGVTAKGGMRSALISWNAEYFATGGYNVYRATSAGGPYTKVTATPVATGTTTYTDTGLNDNTTYYYKVSSINLDSGEGSQSATPASATTGSVGTGTGLLGIYYDDGGVPITGSNPQVVDPTTNFRGRVFTRVDSTVNYDWGNNAPIAGMGVDQFSTRWKGQVQAPVTDYYTFFLNTDDGGGLWINGQKLIDDPTYHGVGTETTSETLVPGGILLQAGQKYDIVMEQFENGGGAAANLRWQTSGIAKSIIPQSQLYPYVETVAPTTSAYELTATATGPNTIEVTWKNDDAKALGVRLLRSGSASGPWYEIRVAGDRYIDTVWPGQTYYYKAIGFNLAGDAPAASNTASATTPASALTGPGLLGSYWSNRTMNGPAAFQRVDADITWNAASTGNVAQTGVINWPDLNPNNNVTDSPLNTGIAAIDDGDTISVRWEGTFTPTLDGNYTFFTRTDDDVRFWLNGRRLLAYPNPDNFNTGRGAPGAPGDTSPAVALKAGTPYAIMMEYNQGGGDARAELRWKAPDMSAAAMLQTTYNGQTVVTADVIAPAAPTQLVMQPGVLTATLRWVDNSLSESSYQVEISRDGGNTFTPLASLPAISNMNGAPANGTYRVTGLTPSTAYAFRVAAVNTANQVYSSVVNNSTSALVAVAGTAAPATGDTNLVDTSNVTWWHWGQGHDVNMMNIPGGTGTGLTTITSVTVEGSDGAFSGTNGVQAQRENDLGGSVVLFAEDVPAYLDRTHQWNGARFTSAGVLTTTVSDSNPVVPIPAYLVGNEYVSTMNGNRDNANFKMHVKVDKPVIAYLLIDNRVGDNANANPPALGNGIMDWVINDGWTIMNTGISPNGQPDFIGIDEGSTPANFGERSTNTASLATGPGNGLNQFFTIYSKNFAGGSTIDLQQQNNGGLNMYGLVVHALGGTNIQTIGAGTPTFADTTGKTFTWTQGYPTQAATATDDAIAVSGAGNGFKFTVPASHQSRRQLKVYVGVDDTQGEFKATLSDGSMLPFVDSSLVDSAPGIKTAVYTINYKAELPNQSLTVEWKNLTATGKVVLSAATVSEVEPPSVPTDLVATSIDGDGIRLNWTDTANNETGFKVERKAGVGGAWQGIVDLGLNATSYTDNDASLVPNTTYYYRVRAVGAGGESDASTEADAVKSMPLAPTGVFAGPDDGQVIVGWSQGPSSGLVYTIRRATTAGGPYTTIASNVSGNSYTDAGVFNRTTYYYVVAATQGGVAGPDSAEVSATPSHFTPVVKVNFTNDSDDTREDQLGQPAGFVFDYGYEFGNTGSDPVTGPHQQYTYAGNTYRYGWGLMTDMNGDTIPDTFVPTVNTANARDRDSANTPAGQEQWDSLNHMQKGGTNADSWDIEVPNGEYRVLVGSADPDNTDAYFSIDAEGVLAVLGEPSASNRFILGVNDSGAYVDVVVNDGALSIRNNTAKQAEWTALTGQTGNEAGNNKIAFIEIYKIDPTLTPPAAAPIGLAADTASNGIKVTWTDTADEKGFRVERRAGANGTWQLAGQVGKDVVTFTDSDPALIGGAEYFYRVAAFNSDGVSGPSNIDGATAPQLANPLVVAGTPGADTFYVRREGDNVKVYSNLTATGIPAANKKLSDITSFSIDGAGGDDLVVLDLSGGGIVPTGGLSINGGEGENAVNVRGLATGDLTIGDTQIQWNGSAASYSNATVELGKRASEINGGAAVTEFKSLSLTGTAKAKIAAAGLNDSGQTKDQVLVLSGLNIASGAQLDVQDGSIILKGVSDTAATAQQLTDKVNSGRTAGANAWEGPGIVSSNAKANELSLTTVGVLDNNSEGAAFKTEYYGVPVDASTVILKYTYFGDTDLDGEITGSDYAVADIAFWLGTPNPGWKNGDNNGDGVVDGSDYAIMDLAFWLQEAGNPLGGELFDEPIVAQANAAALGQSDAVIGSQAAVKPEEEASFLTDDIAVLA